MTVKDSDKNRQNEINKNIYDELKDPKAKPLCFGLGMQMAAAVLLIAAATLLALALGLGERYSVFAIIRTVFFVVVGYLLLGASLPLVYHKSVTPTEKDDFACKNLCADELSDKELVLCVDDNVEALLKRIWLINAARRNLVYSTMDFRDDESGRDVLAALLAAAERGVRVRLLIDGLHNMSFLRSPYLRALAAHSNVAVKRYNPPFLLKPWRLNMRLHDKYILVDDACYLLGGRNTGNLFLGDYGGRKNIDRELLVTAATGKPRSMTMLQEYFGRMWRQSCCHAVGFSATAKSAAKAAELRQRYDELKAAYPESFAADLSEEMCEADRITLLHNHPTPTNKTPVLWWQLCRLMEQGRAVLVQTPYLILSKGMLADLQRLTAVRGKALEIITNAVETGANAWGCSDYLNSKKKLLAAGMHIYECVSEDSCHLKTLMVDDRLSLVGSFNFDMRSAYLDTELMLAVDSPQLNRVLRQNAVAGINKSRLVKGSGCVSLGCDYREISMPLSKKLLYSFLRVIIIPFRHLL